MAVSAASPDESLPTSAAAATSYGPLKVWGDRDGRLLRLRLAKPKANLIDAAMIAGLHHALTWHCARPGLLAVLLDHEGPHFSFGASVEEHLPAQCTAMLEGLHRLVLQMVEYPVPILVAVRGQCLGGGLEVACAGGMIFAAPDAQLGQPEIRLGVFAPAASVLLPPRIGQIAAEDLLISGRSVDAAEAHALRLVSRVADDPEAAACEYFDRHIARLSAAALGHALGAARGGYAAEVRRRIAEVERRYLEQLMHTHDALEGLEAFVAKRPPLWHHR